MRDRRRRDESGAIAVLVALLSVVLIGMCSFVADIGLAYAAKHQTQTAADAAALGAAGVYAQQPDRLCEQVLATGTVDADAEAAAKVPQNAHNVVDATLAHYDADCTDEGLVVTATVESSSPSFFGGLFGADDYELSRSAAAVVEPATTVGSGLRPVAVCASDLPASILPGDAFRLYAPGNGHTPPGGCPIPPNPGNWWTLDCPTEGADDGHGNSALEEQVLLGCNGPVSIVEGQGDATGQALNDILASACPSPSSEAPYDCLGGDPGMPDAGHVEDAWQELIDEGTTFAIPVFCAPPTCAQSSITGSGTNAVFPVHRFVSVDICGFHFGKQSHRKYRDPVPSDACAAQDAELDALMADDSDKVYLSLVFQNLQVSGGTSPAPCKLGEGCDSGLRQVRMVAMPDDA